MLAAPASAAVDEAVRQATAHVEAGRAGDAYALLAPLARQRAGDPDFDYALGLAAADSGRPAEAIIAFQRVLAVQPGNAPARAEIARAYALANDINTARAQFDTVVDDPSLPDPVRQRFNRIVRDYDRQIAGGGAGLTGFVDLTGGWDSNVNTATDLTQITIPLFAAFGPGALGAGAREIEDSFYEAQAGLSAAMPVSRQTRAFASLLGAWRDNNDTRAFDQGSATLTAGIGHTLASRDVISLSVQGQEFWLGHDPYRESVGLVGQFTHPLAGGRALTVSGQYFSLDYDTDDLRDAGRYGLTLTYLDRTYFGSVSVGAEKTDDDAGDHLSNRYASLSGGFEKPLAPTLAVTGGIELEARRYDAADPLFLAEREDEQANASLGLKWLIVRGVYLRPRVTWTRNWSNIALYDYDRTTAGIGIRAEF